MFWRFHVLLSLLRNFMFHPGKHSVAATMPSNNTSNQTPPVDDADEHVHAPVVDSLMSAYFAPDASRASEQDDDIVIDEQQRLIEAFHDLMDSLYEQQ